MKSGCILGLDYWAETGCAGKHAYVDEYFDGNRVNNTGFTSNLGSIDNLPLLMPCMNLIKRMEPWS